MGSKAGIAGTDAMRRAFASAENPRQIADVRERHADAIAALSLDHLEAVMPTLSARRRFSKGQRTGFAVLGLSALPALILVPTLLAVAMNAVFLVFTLATLILRAAVLWLSAGSPRPALDGPDLADADLPVVTILCPVFREASMLPGLVSALARLDYPADKLDVKILMEAEDTGTITAASQLSVRFELDLVVVPPGGPQTKPRACNHGLWSARGSLLVIYDAEDEPEPQQLRKAAAAFAAAPAQIVCLQARLNYRGWDRNWLTRMFAVEYALLFDLILPGLDRLGAPLPLGGTSNVFLAVR